MGHNLKSACHRCRVQITHYRGQENESILPFYLKHQYCGYTSYSNVITVLEENAQDLQFLENEAEGGYKDLTEEPK